MNKKTNNKLRWHYRYMFVIVTI